jgi:hypothetical protein
MEMRLKNMGGGFGAVKRCGAKPGIDGPPVRGIGTESILQ